METEEDRRAILENDAATKRLGLAMEMDKERKSRLEKMVATTELILALIKGVVNVGVVLSLKLIPKKWQLCLSFKLDVHRHPLLKKYRSIIIVCFSHSSLYLPNNFIVFIYYIYFVG